MLLLVQTADDLERQQAAAAARRAKESPAAAAAVVAELRAAAAVAARALPSPQQQLDRRQAVVGKLKNSLQRRRSSGNSGGSQQQEVAGSQPTAGTVQEQPPVQTEQSQEPHAVVLGLPVLPPPPPMPQLHHPAAVHSCVAGLPLEAAPVMGVPAAPQAASQASTTQQSQDPLLQLIEQAEQLKAALQQAGSSNGGSSSVQRPLLSVAAAAPGTATAPRLPNLLLPQADGSLSAATAALLAAAQALRIEGEQQQPQQQPGGSTALQPSRHQDCLPLPVAGVTAFAAATVPMVVPAVSVDSSDAESDAEDALLESLFFKQQRRQPALAAAASSAAGSLRAEQQQLAAGVGAQVRPQLVLQVQLQSLVLGDCGGSGSGSSSVRCVVKPLHSGGQAQQLTLPVAAAAGAGAAGAAPTACCVEAPLPAAAGPGESLRLPPYLFLEFWRHSGSLLGMTKVPLLQPSYGGSHSPPSANNSAAGQELSQQPQKQAQQETAGRLPAVVAEGRQPISNILEGREAGSILVGAVLQVRPLGLSSAVLRWPCRLGLIGLEWALQSCSWGPGVPFSVGRLAAHCNCPPTCCRSMAPQCWCQPCATALLFASAARTACPARPPMRAQGCVPLMLACCVTAFQVCQPSAAAMHGMLCSATLLVLACYMLSHLPQNLQLSTCPRPCQHSCCACVYSCCCRGGRGAADTRSGLLQQPGL